MKGILEFLQGKKTYITFGIAFVLGGLAATGVIDQDLVMKIDLFLAPLGFAFLRAGVSKSGK